MSTDGQGRPLSDDRQWAWNGTEWVPAAGGAADPPAPGSEGDMGATMIAPSPFASGGAPAGGQPAYGSFLEPSQSPAAQSPAGGGSDAPGFGGFPGPDVPSVGGFPGPGTPGFGGAPGGYGAPPAPRKSRTPLIAGIAGGLVVIAAVVVILIVTLGGGKSAARGLFTCTAPNVPGSATIALSGGNKYALSDNGKSGTFTKSGSILTFHGGSLDKGTGTLSGGSKTLKLSFSGRSLTCKK
jgi:hypothetical protein